VRAAIAAALVVTAALGVALVLRPGDQERALSAWLLALGALALLGLVRFTRGSFSTAASQFDRSLVPRAEPSPPHPERDRLERELSLGTQSAFDVHYRLRPLLREIAAHRLATRRGLELDRGGDEVRLLLGRIGWEICRPDRERPADHFGPAPRLDQVREAVDALERI
jgi:hypothetical protein